MNNVDSKIELLEKLYLRNENSTGIDTDSKTFSCVEELNKEMDGFAKISYDDTYNQFHLQITNQIQFDCFYNELLKLGVKWTQNDRAFYIIYLLLEKGTYIKANELSEMLYVSQRQISSDLQIVRTYLEQFKLTINSQPYKGMIIEGEEKNKRSCLSSLARDNKLIVMSALSGNDIYQQIDEMNTIKNIVSNALEKYNIQLSEYLYENFIMHLFISVMRIRRHYEIHNEPSNKEEINNEEDMAVKEIVKKLSVAFSINFSSDEQEYVAAHLKGKRKYTENNYFVNSEINELVMRFLDRIDYNNGTNLKSDFKLGMNLCLHFQAMVIRIKYDIVQKNPLLPEIKRRFIYEFELASDGASVINETYHCKLSDDEIGYLAIEIRASLEKMNEGSKSKILLICSTGRGSAELMKIKFMSSFKDYISDLRMCASNEIEKYDLDSFDYIFSTIPVFIETKTPLIRVSSFLDDADIYHIQHIFKSDRNILEIHKYFHDELIIPRLKASTKEEAIKKIIDHLKNYREIPDIFYDSVIAREKLYSTSFGNQAAFPHPLETILSETFTVFAVLEEPINWGSCSVQLIALTSIENSPNKNLQQFYDMIALIIGKQENVLRFINKPSVSTIEEIVFENQNNTK